MNKYILSTKGLVSKKTDTTLDVIVTRVSLGYSLDETVLCFILSAAISFLSFRFIGGQFCVRIVFKYIL